MGWEIFQTAPLFGSLITFLLEVEHFGGFGASAMDRGDIYGAGSSLRAGGSNSFWRGGNTMDVFSRSSRGEDDEEALKWAALEKLPTFDRLRKGILRTAGGVPSEIDIHSLGFHDKQQLIERLVKIAETDNEQFLLKLKNRIDK